MPSYEIRLRACSAIFRTLDTGDADPRGASCTAAMLSALLCWALASSWRRDVVGRLDYLPRLGSPASSPANIMCLAHF
eukprot:3134677-Pleurochrysis_carterae.AAC.1